MKYGDILPRIAAQAATRLFRSARVSGKTVLFEPGPAHTIDDFRELPPRPRAHRTVAVLKQLDRYDNEMNPRELTDEEIIMALMLVGEIT